MNRTHCIALSLIAALVFTAAAHGGATIISKLSSIEASATIDDQTSSDSDQNTDLAPYDNRVFGALPPNVPPTAFADASQQVTLGADPLSGLTTSAISADVPDGSSGMSASATSAFSLIFDVTSPLTLDLSGFVGAPTGVTARVALASSGGGAPLFERETDSNNWDVQFDTDVPLAIGTYELTAQTSAATTSGFLYGGWELNFSATNGTPTTPIPLPAGLIPGVVMLAGIVARARAARRA